MASKTYSMKFIELEGMERGLGITQEVIEIDGEIYRYEITDEAGNTFLCKNKTELIDEVMTRPLSAKPFCGL